MNSLLDDNFHEIDFSKYKFLGKLAGKSWNHEKAVDRLSAVRKIIWVMAILVY